MKAAQSRDIQTKWEGAGEGEKVLLHAHSSHAILIKRSTIKKNTVL